MSTAVNGAALGTFSLSSVLMRTANETTHTSHVHTEREVRV